jgi:tRNA wybutosine-synthesizing protein 1
MDLPQESTNHAPPKQGTNQALSKQGYHLVAHGAVKPCLWLNRSMRGGDQCYKHHFYGISSHRCVQMTPTLQCNHLCLHCWRPIEEPLPPSEESWAEPRELLDGILHEQKRILTGYGGAESTDRLRLDEAKKPKHVALSLMGEPTFYPHLCELLEEIDSRSMTSFLVSNGTRPDVLEEVRPTQLYLSLNAPNEEIYHRTCNPASPDLWSRIQESLTMLDGSKSRSVIRMTLVKGLNMSDLRGYARLLEQAQPDFVEVKAYMHLGRSRKRLERESMPSHYEVMDFAREIAEATGYSLAGEVPLSRVALLSSGRRQASIFD